VSGRVDFLVDTGATFSALSEREAVIIGIDLPTLPREYRGEIGFGGEFTPRVLNKETRLTFYGTRGTTYTHRIRDLRVISPPENLDREKREELLARTPSILGYDVLSDFELHMNKRKVELKISEKRVGKQR